MIWTYCETWNNLTEEPMNPLTAEDAYARHVSGQLYNAVASSPGQPSPELRVGIRLETGYAAVTFMDEYGRDTLSYTFTLLNGWLFLETANTYGYGDSEERGGYADADYTESYDFTPNGVMEQTIESDGDESRESRNGIDVTSNWEPIPEFGAYDSLIRRERT